MKHEKRLASGERWDVASTGQYIGYVGGAGEIELSIDGEVHYLSVNEVHESKDGFSNFSVKNMSDLAGDFVIKAGMGKLNMAGEGQTTEVLRIRETVKTEVLNIDDMSAPIVLKIGELISSVINIRAITETLKTQIMGLVETQEKPATSIITSEKTFVSGELFTVPENTNRRDITIFAAETNTDTVTVAGIPLGAGQWVGLEKYIGAVKAQAVAVNDQITITEVIK